MKHIQIIIARISCPLFFLSLLIFTSCDKSFLDTKPSTQFAEQDVWSDPNLIQLNINNIYRQIEWSFLMTDLSVDEARCYDGGNDYNMSNMLISPDNAGWGNWDGNYRAIRDCNIFLENIDKFSDDGSLIDGVTLKDRFKGEALFLRAWFYQKLVSYFGGVPIITHSYSLNDEFTAPRNTYAECIQFISDQ